MASIDPMDFIKKAAEKLVEANDEKAKKALHISKESAASLFETYYFPILIASMKCSAAS